MNRRVKNRLQIFRTREECVFAKTELSVLTLDKSDFLKIFHQYDSFEGSVQTKFLKTLLCSHKLEETFLNTESAERVHGNISVLQTL